MNLWKSFFPASNAVEALDKIKGSSFFVDCNNNPRWESVYLGNDRGDWVVLTWNYFDIEFKFETYGISIGAVGLPPTALLKAGNLPEYEKIDFYARTEWTRPALPGEVPADFEQIIEGAGCIAQVPADAISVGSSLYAVVFRSIKNASDVMISIDDDAAYSLKSTTGSHRIAALLQSYDVFDASELITWEPPS